MHVLRGATVVDGTGAAAYLADVVIDGDRIVSIGGDCPAEAQVVDLEGLVLAPGFIDPHTHLDCQILWDPDVTPSASHGVTTVVMGNCGFTIAPVHARDRDTIIRTLENVEGMSADALRAGIDWTFETIPEYLNTLEAIPKRVNVGVLVGHTAVRLYTMGEAASERAATAEEIDEMREIVREALREGAVGFSTSCHPAHLGAGGRPVPSYFAERSEVDSLAGVLGEEGKGSVELVAGPNFGPAECAELSERIGRPVTWLGLATGRGGVNAKSDLTAPEVLDAHARLPGQSVPQISCRPLVSQLTLTTFIPLAQMSAAFKDLVSLALPDLIKMYGDPEWRAAAIARIEEKWKPRLSLITVDETRVHSALIGQSLGELAEARGQHPLEVMLDLGLAEDLSTRFRMVMGNDDEDELALLLADERCIVGLSDAGAHVDQLCDAVYPTFMLDYWVRQRGAMSLEMAVWRLTGQPADIFGLPGRGRIAPGYFADLVAFDPERIGALPLRRVWDWPGGADRLIGESVGLEHVWVNGTPVRTDGVNISDSRPGQLIRA